jgi:putative heme transporter
VADHPGVGPSAPVGTDPVGRRSWLHGPHFTWGRRAVALLVFLAVLEYLVLPQVAGTRAALHTLSGIQPGWVVLGVALEALSLVSYSLLTRSVLPGKRPTFSWLLRTDLTAFGVSHIVPGGTATAAALRYRLLRQGGTPREDAIVGATVQAIGAFVVLAALLLLGLVSSIPFAGVEVGYLTAAAVDAVVIGLLVAAVVGLARGDERSAAGAIARFVGWLPRRVRPRARRVLGKVVTQVYEIVKDKEFQRSSAMWAGANWALDAASLWVFLAAFGWHANPTELLIGYGLANVVAVLPISPGGLGVIEGILIPTLVGFGAPSAAAVLGVVAWRLFSFWAPIPVSGLCYLSLRSQNWRDRYDLRRTWKEFGTVLSERRMGSTRLASEPDDDPEDPG